MGITENQQALFIVCTKRETISEFVSFDKKNCGKMFGRVLKSSLKVTLFIPALLLFKPIILCAKCRKVLLEEWEIETKDQSAEISIQCDTYMGMLVGFIIVVEV